MKFTDEYNDNDTIDSFSHSTLFFTKRSEWAHFNRALKWKRKTLYLVKLNANILTSLLIHIEFNNVELSKSHILTALLFKMFEKFIHSTILTYYETEILFQTNKQNEKKNLYACWVCILVPKQNSQLNCSFNFVKKLFPFSKYLCFVKMQTALTSKL